MLGHELVSLMARDQSHYYCTEYTGQFGTALGLGVTFLAKNYDAIIIWNIKHLNISIKF